MTPERFAEVERICQAALGLPAAHRAAYLDEACAGDAALRAEVASLLAGASAANALLETPPVVAAAAPGLGAGDRLGVFEITSEIGAGGMGVVYRARDTRLGRTVAIKVIGDGAALDPAARERFTREARLVASLNHPHICALYDVGREGDLDFLVMEFVDGETVATRLTKGPLPPEQALEIATQVGEALAAAHRQGVIHRDLKPANVMLTKAGAKLLDFGLAKLVDRGPRAVAGPAWPAAATRYDSITVPGLIVGTVQYMAPEQVEGKPADARTDLWALGALIYEMVAGRPPFDGTSAASLMGAILERDPAPLDSLRPGAPPALGRVVEKCLAKDPERRWQSARDLADELKWVAGGGSRAAAPGPASAARTTRTWLRWVLEGALVVSLVAALPMVANYFRDAPPRVSPVRFPIPPPEGGEFRYWDSPAVSPDGERIVFGAGAADGKERLWLRRLDSMATQPLLGNEVTASEYPHDSSTPSGPFWSPDSRQVAFFAGGYLMKTDLSGIAPRRLCDRRGGGAGGAWSREGVIVFNTPEGPLYRVPDRGGVAVPVTTLDTSRQETSHGYPWFLPDGRHFLYLARSSTPGNTGVFVGSLDGARARPILAGESFAMYAPPGYLLFQRGQVLLAQPFDAERMRLTGEPLPVAEQVGSLVGSTAALQSPIASVSEAGVLCYLYDPGLSTRLQWFDRAGAKLATLGDPGDYTNPALSPDEVTLAVGRRDPQTGTRDIWVLDIARGASSRLTVDPADDFNPAWSPDGKWVAFSSNRRGFRDIYRKLATGVGDDELLLGSNENKSVEDWTLDDSILFNTAQRGGTTEVWALPDASRPAGGRRPAAPVVRRFSGNDQAQVSRDGRWIAYSSIETGKAEVYLQAYPPTDARWLVSPKGGREPKWRRDGGELYYLEANTLKAVEVNVGSGGTRDGSLRTLFTPPIDPQRMRRNRYVVTRDGRRFLVVVPVPTDPRVLQVIINWPAGLKVSAAR
jgi:Tol biopolymer transport system component